MIGPIIIPPSRKDDDDNTSTDGWIVLTIIVSIVGFFLTIPIWAYYLDKWWSFLTRWIQS